MDLQRGHLISSTSKMPRASSLLHEPQRIDSIQFLLDDPPSLRGRRAGRVRPALVGRVLSRGSGCWRSPAPAFRLGMR